MQQVAQSGVGMFRNGTADFGANLGGLAD